MTADELTSAKRAARDDWTADWFAQPIDTSTGRVGFRCVLREGAGN